MNISKKIINFIFVIAILVTSYSIAQTTKKVDPKDLKQFGLRYLNHLVYEIPVSELGDATEKNPNPRFNPDHYIDAINNHYEALVSIAFINDDVGYGVFAEQDIKKGQMIGEYTGIVKKVNFSNKPQDYDYAWGFPPPTKGIIDAKDAGNFTRFINHSNRPNIDMAYVPINNRWHLAYVANQDIKKDQQLLANYGRPYWRGRGIRPYDLK